MMNGARRVVVFCLLTTVLPTILIITPLYLRHNVFHDVVYEVAESDVLKLGEDISTVFCQDHTLKMNSSFNAYQVDSNKEMSTTRKHIRLKKSMRLPDDTLEYWGFFLPKGSTVKLSVCSRYDGSRILVVRGEKNLKTCGLLDHSNSKGSTVSPVPREHQDQVRVRFEMDPDNPLEPSHEKIPQHKTDLNDSVATSTERVPLNNDATNNLVDTNVGAEDDQDVDNGSSVNLHHLNMIENHEGDRNSTDHKLRHSKRRDAKSRKRRELNKRLKRSALPVQPHNLDAKVLHGGNAETFVESQETSSASSFEAGLLECYDGDVLLKQDFLPSKQCVNVNYLLSNTSTGAMATTHTVKEDGYYYYIFYSDNDLVRNDIHAIFDIYKPTYQLANITKKCVNQTLCSFPVTWFADELVIVEVATRDGIEHEEDDLTTLVSICQPRMAIYIIFPLLVLILILGCAFL